MPRAGQPHVRVASNWLIEVPSSAEKLKLLVGPQMPDKWIIDRGLMGRDIAQCSILGLHGTVCHQPDVLRAWPQVHVDEPVHVLVLRIFGYPNCHIVVAAIYGRRPLSNVSNYAAQNDRLIQSFDY